MVQQNIMCPSCRQEKSFFEDGKLTWRDLQGLSWLFCEDCITDPEEKIRPTYAYA